MARQPGSLRMEPSDNNCTVNFAKCCSVSNSAWLQPGSSVSPGSATNREKDSAASAVRPGSVTATGYAQPAREAPRHVTVTGRRDAAASTADGAMPR